MSRVPSADLSGVGYDIAVRISPASYESEFDVHGRAWAFALTDQSRRGLTEAVRRALDEPPDEIEIEPGYVRVRYASLSPQHVTGSEILSNLRNAAGIYNEATADGEEVRFAPESFAATFVPDDAPTTEALIERFDERADPATPDDETVWSYEREEADPDALSSDQRFGARVVIPFDTAAMYDPEPSWSTAARSLPVTWDAPEVHQRLTEIVEDLVTWPGGREEIARVTVRPSCATVDVYRDGVAPNAAAIAARCRSALVRYNKHPPVEQERASNAVTMKHPKIAFSGSPAVVGLDHGLTFEDWADAYNLTEMSGEPTDPDPDDDDPDADESGSGSVLTGINPFGET